MRFKQESRWFSLTLWYSEKPLQVLVGGVDDQGKRRDEVRGHESVGRALDGAQPQVLDDDRLDAVAEGLRRRGCIQSLSRLMSELLLVSGISQNYKGDLTK